METSGAGVVDDSTSHVTVTLRDDKFYFVDFSQCDWLISTPLFALLVSDLLETGLDQLLQVIVFMC